MDVKKKAQQKKAAKAKAAREAEASRPGGEVGADGLTYKQRQNRKRAEKKKRKNGYVVQFEKVKLGTITAWGGNISCKCLQHKKCTLPAYKMTEVGTDDMLIRWLLQGVSLKGKKRFTSKSHQLQWKGLD